jgi:predicted nucleic acid-binding protein
VIFGDQAVSFTDALSFAVMRRMRIERAFSFDRHFALAGFELWPR